MKCSSLSNCHDQVYALIKENYFTHTIRVLLLLQNSNRTMPPTRKTTRTTRASTRRQGNRQQGTRGTSAGPPPALPGRLGTTGGWAAAVRALEGERNAAAIRASEGERNEGDTPVVEVHGAHAATLLHLLMSEDRLRLRLRVPAANGRRLRLHQRRLLFLLERLSRRAVPWLAA